jgi:hypothetical protein
VRVVRHTCRGHNVPPRLRLVDPGQRRAERHPQRIVGHQSINHTLLDFFFFSSPDAILIC